MTNKLKIVVLLLASLAFLASCSDGNSGDADGEGPIVLEPGISSGDPDPDSQSPEDDDAAADDPADNPAGDGFIDKGEATTVADLIAAHDKITSYYFEQTIPYADGSVSLKVWYADNKMKVVANAAGGEINESYYDYNERTMIYYTPADGNDAIKMDFNPDGEDAPDNPKDEDYAACIMLGKEELNGQLCYILQTGIGDKLWVSTKYGFPLQVEFVDHLGDTYTVEYRNLEINTVSADEVAVPDHVSVTYLGGGSAL